MLNFYFFDIPTDRIVCQTFIYDPANDAVGCNEARFRVSISPKVVRKSIPQNAPKLRENKDFSAFINYLHIGKNGRKYDQKFKR